MSIDNKYSRQNLVKMRFFGLLEFSQVAKNLEGLKSASALENYESHSIKSLEENTITSLNWQTFSFRFKKYYLVNTNYTLFNLSIYYLSEGKNEDWEANGYNKCLKLM